MKNTFYRFHMLFRVSVFILSSFQMGLANTYYFDGTGPVNLVSRWWSSADFSGSHPAAFNGGHTFIIPKGTHAYSNATWNFNASGTILVLDTNASLDLESNLSMATGTLLKICKGGVLDADTFSLSGAGALDISSGRLRLAKNDVVLPELTGAYLFDQAVVEIYGSGLQTVRGGRSYSTLEFSGAGLKNFSAAITGSNTLDSLAITGINVVNAENRSIGGNETSVFMNAGSFAVAGTGQKPDAAGEYTLLGGEIVFAGVSAVTQTVRNGIRFFGLRISGSNVSPSTGMISVRNGGYFTVDSGAVWNMSNTNIGIVAEGGLDITINGLFKVYHAAGFIGLATTAIRGNPALPVFGPYGSVEYGRAGTQNISELTYRILRLSGSGKKNASALTIDRELSIEGTAEYEGFSPVYNEGASLIYRSGTPGDTFFPGNEWTRTHFPTHLKLDIDVGSRLFLEDDRTLHGELQLVSGIFHLDSVRLVLPGKVSGQGKIAANGNSSLLVTGKGDYGTLYMDQSVPGISNAWRSMEIDRDSSGTVRLGNETRITEKLDLLQGTLYTNEQLVLSYNPDGSYGQLIKNGGNVSGDVVCEVVVNGSEGWRYISSPVKTTLADIDDDFPLSFTPASANVFHWEASSSRWKIPPGKMVDWNGTLPVAVFFPASSLPCSIRVKGMLWDNPVINKLYYDNSGSPEDFFGSPDGWNMVGNPYPFTLDWYKVYAKIGGTANTHYYVYNPVAGTYFSHNGSSGHPQLSGGIAPFQAFFVKLGQASDTLVHGIHFDSSQYKNETSPLFKKDPSGIVFSLTAPVHSPVFTSVWQEQLADTSFDSRYDAFFLGARGKSSSVLFIRSGEKALSGKYIPVWKPGVLVKLEFKMPEAGEYVLNAMVKGLPAHLEVWLTEPKTKRQFRLEEDGIVFNAEPGITYYFDVELREGRHTAVYEYSGEPRPAPFIKEGKICVPDSWSQTGEMKLFDLAGRLVYSGSLTSAGNQYAGGWYIFQYQEVRSVRSGFIYLPNP